MLGRIIEAQWKTFQFDPCRTDIAPDSGRVLTQGKIAIGHIFSADTAVAGLRLMQ